MYIVQPINYRRVFKTGEMIILGCKKGLTLKTVEWGPHQSLRQWKMDPVIFQMRRYSETLDKTSFT